MSLFLFQQKIPFNSVASCLRIYQPGPDSPPDSWAIWQASDVSVGDIVFVFEPIFSPWGDGGASGVAEGDSFSVSAIMLVHKWDNGACSYVVTADAFERQNVQSWLAQQAHAAKASGNGIYMAIARGTNELTPDMVRDLGELDNFGSSGFRKDDGQPIDLVYAFATAASWGVMVHAGQQPDISQLGYGLFCDKEPAPGSVVPDLRPHVQPVSKDERKPEAHLPGDMSAAPARPAPPAPTPPPSGPRLGLPKMPSFFKSKQQQPQQPEGKKTPRIILPGGIPAASSVQDAPAEPSPPAGSPTAPPIPAADDSPSGQFTPSAHELAPSARDSQYLTPPNEQPSGKPAIADSSPNEELPRPSFDGLPRVQPQAAAGEPTAQSPLGALSGELSAAASKAANNMLSAWGMDSQPESSDTEPVPALSPAELNEYGGAPVADQTVSQAPAVEKRAAKSGQPSEKAGQPSPPPLPESRSGKSGRAAFVPLPVNKPVGSAEVPPPPPSGYDSTAGHFGSETGTADAPAPDKSAQQAKTPSPPPAMPPAEPGESATSEAPKSDPNAPRIQSVRASGSPSAEPVEATSASATGGGADMPSLAQLLGNISRTGDAAGNDRNDEARAEAVSLLHAALDMELPPVAGADTEDTAGGDADSPIVSSGPPAKRKQDEREPSRPVKEPIQVKSGVAGLVSKLEQQASKASSRLELQVDELQSRLSSELSELMAKVSSAETRTERNATDLRAELTERMHTATQNVTEKITASSWEGSEKIRNHQQSGNAQIDEKHEFVRTSLSSSFDEVRARAEAIVKDYQDLLATTSEASLKELDSLKSQLTERLSGLYGDYDTALQAAFDEYQSRLASANSSVASTLEARATLLQGQLAGLRVRCLSKLEQSRLASINQLQKQFNIAQSEVRKLRVTALEETVYPRLRQHREEMRIATAEFQSKLADDLEKKSAEKLSEFDPLLTERKKKLVELLQDTAAVKDALEHQLRERLQKISEELKSFVEKGIQDAHNAHKQTEEQLSEIDRAVRALADPSSIEGDLDLLNERNRVLSAMDEATEKAKEEVLSTLRASLASLEEKGKQLQEELISSMEEDAYRVRRASEQALNGIREAIKEAFSAIQSAQDERMPM